MTFPGQKFPDIISFSSAYFETLQAAAASVDREALIDAADILRRAYGNGARIYVCGNGGSAAISNHFACDHLKGVQTDTKRLPRVISLSSTIETITAIANDISYDDVFAYQLNTLAESGDVLITISASGDSENIVRACEWGRLHGMQIISMTGFEGGRSKDIASVSLHVDGDNYGIIEDVHQSIMHILAQYIRQAEMDESLIPERKF